MNRKEKIIKSRLEKFEIDDNQIDSLDLWNAIEPGLLAPKKKERRSWFFLLFVGFLAVSLLSTLLYIGKTNMSKFQINHKSFEQNKDSTSSRLEQNSVSLDKTNDIGIVNLGTNKELKNLTQSKTLKEELKNLTQSKTPKEELNKSVEFLLAENIETTQVKQLKTEPYNNDSKNKNSRVLLDKRNHPKSDVEKQIFTENNHSDFNVSNKKTLSVLPLEQNISLLSYQNGVIAIPDSFSETTKPDRNHLELSLYGGLNSISFDYGSQYDDAYKQLLSEINTSVKGVTYGTQISYVIKNKIILSTGLAYHELFSNLNTTETTYQSRTTEDVVVRSWYDSFSGNTIKEEYGNAVVTDTLIRNISHYNKFNRFSLPLNAGIRIKKTPFSIDLLLGISLNRTTRNSGYHFTPDMEIKMLNEKSFFSIGWQIESKIRLDLSQKYFIFLSPKWSYGNNINYTSESKKHKAQQLNLNLGAGYTF